MAPPPAAAAGIGLAPREAEPTGRRWGHFLRLLTSYWVSRDWVFAWVALIFQIGTLFGGVYVSVLLTQWELHLFDAIQQLNTHAAVALIAPFLVIVAGQVAYSVLVYVVGQLLYLRWRIWLTHRYLDRWLAADRYYDIERLRRVDNPDQRIAEDIDLFTLNMLTIATGVILSVTTAITFGITLWRLSIPVHLVMYGVHLTILGALIWAAVAFNLAASGIVVLVGRRLVGRNMKKQHFEADFRFGLIHVRRNAEQIAFAHAAMAEGRWLRAALELVRANYVRIIGLTAAVSGSSGAFTKFSELIPILMSLPALLARKLTLGQVMQGRAAFIQFSGALFWFSQSFPQLAVMTAVVARLKAFDDAIDAPTVSGIAASRRGGAGVSTQDLRLALPGGQDLLTVGDLQVGEGERWAIRGPSGAGKSTLLRALAGLWPDGSGAVVLPGDGRAMFVPQRPYVPLGPLRGALAFPLAADAFDDARLAEALSLAALPALADRLDAPAGWAEGLSPGELQRVALARILLHRPACLLLDEATSALDTENAQAFYRTLLDRLPGLTLVSVYHGDRLDAFHDHSFCIVDRRAVLSRFPPRSEDLGPR